MPTPDLVNGNFRTIHPDVATVKALLSAAEIGGVIPYLTVSKAIAEPVTSPAFERRIKTAVGALRREGVNITRIPAKGLLRETNEQALARVQERERNSIGRKARKVGETLANIDVTALPTDRHADFFAERTINNLVFRATQPAARRKLALATANSNAVLPMADAIKALE